MPEWSAAETCNDENKEHHHGFSDEEVTALLESEHFMALKPPPGMTAHCNCGEEITFISILVPLELTEPDPYRQVQVVHPCHCMPDTAEFAQIANNIKEN